MVNFEFREHYTAEDLVKIVEILRHPGGCPWDREQTHESLRRCLAEETCEVLEAIDRKDDVLLCEELGDVLLQVVFHASLAADAGKFDWNDVADGISKKMIFRHPHVFGTERADSTDQVLANWDEIKRVEKGQKTETDTLESVARTLPGLWRAEKLQKKAAKSGIVQPTLAGEVQRLQAAQENLDTAVTAEKGDLTAALGQVLFAAAGVALQAGIDPEEALHAACEEYIAHFSRAEHSLQEQERAGSALTAEEAAQLWRETTEEG